MRKPKCSILVAITLMFAVFTLGFFWGRTMTRSEISVCVAESFETVPEAAPRNMAETTADSGKIIFPIPINRADKEQLMALPGIGEVLAQRIIAYRSENGRFSSPEDLLNVEGLGAKRLEEILDLITIGG